MNWPIPAYLSLLPVAATLLRARALPFLRRLAPPNSERLLVHYAGVLLVADVALAVFITGKIPLLPTPSIFVRWDKLGHAAEVAEEAFHQESGSEPFVLADGRYNLASELGFYMRDPGDDGDWRDVIPLGAAVGGGVNYVYWRDAEAFLDRNAIFVSTDVKAGKLAALRRAFARVDEPRHLLTLSRGTRRPASYYVVRCHRLQHQPDSGLPAPDGAYRAEETRMELVGGGGKSGSETGTTETGIDQNGVAENRGESRDAAGYRAGKRDAVSYRP